MRLIRVQLVESNTTNSRIGTAITLQSTEFMLPNWAGGGGEACYHMIKNLLTRLLADV